MHVVTWLASGVGRECESGCEQRIYISKSGQRGASGWQAAGWLAMQLIPGYPTQVHTSMRASRSQSSMQLT